MAKRSGLTNEQARADSTQRFLDAGAALALERARENPFAGIHLRDLCERAGLSSGAFYSLWKQGLPEYYVALGHELINGSLDDAIGQTSDLADLQAGAQQLGPIPAIARMAQADLDSLVATEMWDLSQLLTVTWGRTILKEAGAEGYRAVDEITATVYGGLLRELGREPRPPLEILDIAKILQGLVEGIGMRQRVGLREELPLSLPGKGPAGTFSLYTIGALAVLAVFTRKVGDKRSVGQEVERLLG